MRARREEFMRLTTVKAPTIAIAIKVKESLYHGSKRAIKNEIIQTAQAIISLSVSIFQIIVSFATIHRDISRIASV